MVRRVFIGPNEVAGLTSGLAAGFDKLGVAAEVVTAHENPFQYEATSSRPFIARIWGRLGKLRTAWAKRSYAMGKLGWALWRLWSVVVLIQALYRFDRFVFVFGETITNTRAELFLHRLLGKKLIFLYCGSDARPPFIGGNYAHSNLKTAIETIAQRSKSISSRIRLNERFGLCINSPLTGHYHDRPYINWFSIGIPRALPDILAKPSEPQAALVSNQVRILHSPSSPQMKGTRAICAAIERLRAKGYDIEFVQLSGVPNTEVIKEIARCDFIVDQLYSDTPMAAFATEAAILGRPAVVGSYAASLDLPISPEGMPPSCFVHPDALESAIEGLILDPKARIELGLRAQAFVTGSWKPETVAARYLRLFNNDIPDDWWCSPDAVVYCHGCGLSESRSQELIQALVAERGKQALQLSHKPELEAAFLAYANVSPADSTK